MTPDDTKLFCLIDKRMRTELDTATTGEPKIEKLQQEAVSSNANDSTH
jgi:hypothetical protein